MYESSQFEILISCLCRNADYEYLFTFRWDGRRTANRKWWNRELNKIICFFFLTSNKYSILIIIARRMAHRQQRITLQVILILCKSKNKFATYFFVFTLWSCRNAKTHSEMLDETPSFCPCDIFFFKFCFATTGENIQYNPIRFYEMLHK